MSWIDWTLAEKNENLVRFVSELIKFRKRNEILHRDNFFGDTDAEKMSGADLVWYDFDGRMPDWSKLNRFIACEIFGNRYTNKDGTKGEAIYVAINTDRHDLTVILPSLDNGKVWTRILDSSYPEGEDITEYGKEEVLQSQRRYVVTSHSVVVLMSKPE